MISNIENWNRVFNWNIKNTNDFNEYLKIGNQNIDYAFTDEIGLVIYNNGKYIIEDINGSKIIENPRQLGNVLVNYSIIISNCWIGNLPGVINLRKEIIENQFTGYSTHFFDYGLPFSYDDNRVFFTKDFYNLITSDSMVLDFMIFKSNLLNHFEKGKNYNGIIIKSTVNVSNYGRWYLSGSKIQNNKTERESIIDGICKYGNVITMDLVNGEPMAVANMTKSKTIRWLIEERLKSDNPRIRTMIKELLNIYLHSLLDSKKSYQWFKKENSDYKDLEDILGLKIYSVYNRIDKEVKPYNDRIIDDYKTKLYTYELGKRIVNPNCLGMSDEDIIKEHRKYLQSATNETILMILYWLVKDGIIKLDDILWTIYDSFSIFVENMDLNLVEKIKEISKNIGYIVQENIDFRKN